MSSKSKNKRALKDEVAERGGKAAKAPELSPAQFFEGLPNVLQKAGAKGNGAIYVVNLLGNGGGEWTINLKKAAVERGAAANPDLIIEMAAADFSSMMTGNLDAAKSVREGKLRFKGDPKLMVSLGELLVAHQG